jgi:hypothetical protein
VTDTFKVRASSWGSLFDCPHRWEGTHIMKLRKASGPRAALGTAIHAGTAHYDTIRTNGEDPDPMEAGQVLVDALHHPRDEVDWKADRDLTIKDAERIGLTLLSRYCNDIAPRFHYTAVEMETKPLVIDCGGGVEIELTGTMDRARAIADEWGVRIADLKTGVRATSRDDKGNIVARTKGFGPQLGTYELLYEHTTGEPVTGPGEIIGMNTGKPEVAVGEIKDARKLLVGTDESPGLLQYAAVMFRTGLFPPNPQSTLCSEKYCARWAQCNHHY